MGGVLHVLRKQGIPWAFNPPQAAEADGIRYRLMRYGEARYR